MGQIMWRLEAKLTSPKSHIYIVVVTSITAANTFKEALDCFLNTLKEDNPESNILDFHIWKD